MFLLHLNHLRFRICQPTEPLPKVSPFSTRPPDWRIAQTFILSLWTNHYTFLRLSLIYEITPLSNLVPIYMPLITDLRSPYILSFFSSEQKEQLLRCSKQNLSCIPAKEPLWTPLDPIMCSNYNLSHTFIPIQKKNVLVWTKYGIKAQKVSNHHKTHLCSLYIFSPTPKTVVSNVFPHAFVTGCVFKGIVGGSWCLLLHLGHLPKGPSQHIHVLACLLAVSSWSCSGSQCKQID